MEAIDWGSLTLGCSIHHHLGEHHLGTFRVQVQFDSTQDCQPLDFIPFGKPEVGNVYLSFE